MNVIDKIISHQSGEDIEENNMMTPETIAVPRNNELDNIVQSLKNIAPIVTTNDASLFQSQDLSSNNTNIQNDELPENTYDNILTEIQEHEKAMEIAIKNADELSSAVKDSLMYYLNLKKPNRNGILFQGVPDALSASARLLDLSINGRYKLASMKKLRASILKDKNGNQNNTGEISLAMLLDE